MKEFRIMSLEEAEELARKWIKKLQTCCCDRVDVVAGVYRKKAQNRDVDLICLPKNQSLEPLRRLGPVKEDSIRIVFNSNRKKIEVWKAPEGKYELVKWYRRQGKRRFIELASRAKRRGYQLSWKNGLMKDGEVISRNPSEIEEILE